MRAKSEEKEFAKFLLEIGNGTYPSCESDGDEETVELPLSVITSTDIVTEIYTERGSSVPKIFCNTQK